MTWWGWALVVGGVVSTAVCAGFYAAHWIDAALPGDDAWPRRWR